MTHQSTFQPSAAAVHFSFQPYLTGILGEYVAHKNQIDEYQDEILLHLLEMEQTGRPSLEQMQLQPEITLRMRPLLLDFLMDVINKLNLSKLTFPLTVNLIDRYASVRVVKKKHYQLLGLTALWVACKNMDAKNMIPRLDDLCRYCCRCYDRTMFLEMENHLLKSLQWHVTTPTADNFIDVFIYRLSPYRFRAGSKMTHNECTTIKILANYLCELSTFYPHIHFTYSVPQMALVAIIMSCMIMQVCTQDDLYAILNYMAVQMGASLSNDEVPSDDFDTPMLLTLPQLDHAFLLLTRVSHRPPPSLKSKYFSNDPNCLNLATILAPFTTPHYKPVPVQLPTPLEPVLTPMPLAENSPVVLSSPTNSLAEASATVLNNLSNFGGQQLRGFEVEQVQQPVPETDILPSQPEESEQQGAVPFPLESESFNTDSKQTTVTNARPAAAFPLPLLLPGQEKRKAESEEAGTKRQKIAA